LEEKKEDSDSLVALHSQPLAEYESLGCEPHIYEVSSMAYRGVSIDRKNQTILVSGETGAGKSVTVKLLFQHLASLRQDKVSAGGNSEDDLVQHLRESSPIFEAFGNAKTLRNNNSTRFGKVTKLQYFPETNGASLVGSSFDTYMLETSRVASQADGERNFHIFYQILSAPEELKEELLGPDWGEATPDDFCYLQNSSSNRDAGKMDDTALWSQTWKAMEVFGWDRSILRDLMGALGTILLIGNVQFQDKEGYVGTASISNRSDLSMLAQALGIHVDELERALTCRMVQTAQEKVQVPYTTDAARAARDALAKAIYAGIFASIVRQINLFTSTPSMTTGKHKTISLVDIFGFESFEVNRFEQFCINYAAERLEYKFVRDNFDHFTSEYEAEGIEVSDWKEIDNTDMILLFEGKTGLIRTLNEQSVRPNGSNEVSFLFDPSMDVISVLLLTRIPSLFLQIFVFKAKSAHKGNEIFISEKLQHQTDFGVRHFAGPVVYDASSFIERNVDKLPDALITVASQSSNTLIQRELLQIIKARGGNSSSDGTKKKPTHKTVVQKFCKELRDLLISVDSTETRYIRCIKPCDEVALPKRIDHQSVLRQICCAGLVTLVELSRETFPDNLPFSVVESRFRCLLPGNTLRSIVDMEPHDKAQVLMSAAFAPIIQKYRDSDFSMPFACGHTKVYFRAGALEELDQLRNECISLAALHIQNFFRMSAMKQMYRLVLQGIVLLQAESRRRTQEVLFQRKRESAVLIQTEVRRAIGQSNFLLMKECALVIEEWFRAVLLHLRYQRLKRSTQKIITWSRMQIARRRYNTILQSATTIQAYTRGMEPRYSFCMKRWAQVTISRWWKPIFVRLQHTRIREAAAVITVWGHSKIARLRFMRLQNAIVQLQARVRCEQLSRGYVREKQAAQIITGWSRALLVQKLLKRTQAAGKVITEWAHSRIHRVAFLQTKGAATILTCWYRTRKERMRYLDIQRAASLVRSRRRSLESQQLVAKRHSAARKIQAVVRSRHHKKRTSLEEELEQYKNKVQVLQSTIATVTAESALHMEEVEAEYEERLGEYEDEVLLLRQAIERHEVEKVKLKEEIVANVENVGNLKTGIQSMQESHRDYLNKVMRAIEKANAENAKALDLVKQDRDARVNELTTEIRMLRAGNHPETQKRNYDINRLARKLEKLIAPDYIVAMAEKASAHGMTTVECVEEKVSSKARKIIYRLEDKLSASPNTMRGDKVSEQDADKNRCIEKLQQQLVRAYEEIEAMQTGRGYESRLETEAVRSIPAQKKGLRRVFHR